MIKSHFSRNFYGYRIAITPSRTNKKERMIWQRRYWEHFIRDEEDLQCHMEYIFFNPVKHGLASSSFEWKYGNFQDFVADGSYDKEWGNNLDSGYFKDIGYE